MIIEDIKPIDIPQNYLLMSLVMELFNEHIKNHQIFNSLGLIGIYLSIISA